MRGLLPLLLTALFTAPMAGQEPARYVSQLRLPVDLHTGEGVLLEQGSYDLELRFEKGHHSLAFLRDEQIIAVVNGGPHREEASRSGVLPLVGTLFLRPVAVPIGTDEERHYSKTGQAQYEYEKRDWKATMRVYKSVSPGDKEIRFVLYETGEGGGQMRRDFLLFRDKKLKVES